MTTTTSRMDNPAARFPLASAEERGSGGEAPSEGATMADDATELTAALARPAPSSTASPLARSSR